MPPETPNPVVNKFCKKFYGQDTSSHGKKYSYHRHGLLDDISHHRIIRQVIIIRTEDRKKVTDFLKEYNAEIHTRKVKLTKEDCKNLHIPLK